ncbi:hypothetical protein BDM02DRAFT_3191302 [Thelephora ganbajun]|uniref:Uncharacterized protein n=1 Tax=Thelephora ganbajun TaxID=370292 RepID=A0ACB6Z2K5_THEGA|nr:hypothetical protein BDM02DRAFT_3191302 [Thelephora ganbajun]
MIVKGSPPPQSRLLETTSTTETAVPPHDPPEYISQSQFRVGKAVTLVPFVTPSQLKIHLGLLRAFRELKLKVQESPDITNAFPPLAGALDPEARWVWFLELALERHISEMDSSSRCIAWYAEDLERVHVLAELKNLPVAPIDLLEVAGDLSSYKPSQEVSARWESATRVPYDPFDSFWELQEQEILCPKCNVQLFIPYLTVGQSGYAQRMFAHTCKHCSFLITRSKLAVAKFVHDLVMDPTNTRDAEKYGNAVYLPGTLLDRSGEIDPLKAKATKVRLYQGSFKYRQDINGGTHSPSLRGSTMASYEKDTDIDRWEKDIKEAVKFSLETLRDKLSLYMRLSLLRKVLSAYNDGRPFSLDLVGAVLRQNAFTEKMHQLGWSQPGFFESKEDEIALHHCVARYHAFLDLITSAPTSFFVPTLDIDIAWHTHQLLPQKYGDDCRKYIERFVNHDDKVEESHLSNAFDITCRAWEQRFGIPYMHCGCPLPGDTVGQKLIRLSHSVISRHKASTNPPDRDDCLLATHPSDHNAVYVDIVSHKGRENRLSKTQKRKTRDLEKLKHGELDEKTYNRGLDHDTAFLVPVPMYYGYGIPAAACGGIAGGVGVGCAAAGVEELVVVVVAVGVVEEVVAEVVEGVEVEVVAEAEDVAEGEADHDTSTPSNSRCARLINLCHLNLFIWSKLLLLIDLLLDRLT